MPEQSGEFEVKGLMWRNGEKMDQQIVVMGWDIYLMLPTFENGCQVKIFRKVVTHQLLVTPGSNLSFKALL